MFKIGDKVVVNMGVNDRKTAIVVPKSKIKLNHRGVPDVGQGHYNPMEANDVAIQYVNGDYDVFNPGCLSKIDTGIINVKDSDRYCVQATVRKDGAYGYTVQQIPTFYLYSAVQGITSVEHAEKIVRDILNPFNDNLITVSPNVTKVDD